jgi:hypothetical protein
VEGKAGVGKTALITSQQSLFLNDGHFVTGTFSPHHKSEPFSAIVDALDELFEELLSDEHSLDERSTIGTFTIMTFDQPYRSSGWESTREFRGRDRVKVVRLIKVESTSFSVPGRSTERPGCGCFR